MMAVNKMHGVLLTTVTFFSFALPVLSGSPSTCSDGLGLNYTLPMFMECKEKPHPNGSMVQTIPKLIRLSPAVAGCQKGRRNSGIPAGHRICRFPDCEKNLCKNSWCEETMEGYECHCSTGFQGKHCEDKIKTTTQTISTRSSTTKKTSQAATTPDSTTAEATTMSMTSPKTTAEEQSETTSSQAATTPDSTTPEATTISLTSPEITTEEKSETTPDSTTTEATTISLTSPEITTEDKSETTPDSATTKGATTISLTSLEITTEEKSETTPAASCGSISQSFHRSCYNFSTSKATHASAVSACSQHGSHLVYIGSAEEQDFIMGNIGSSSEDYWIGLTRVPATWLDGSTLTYDNIGDEDWAFNDGGECFIIYNPGRNGRWYDYQCSDESRYICEKEMGAACESNDWQSFDGSCYIFSTSEVNHGSAVSACSEYGSHLVYIGSQEEQDFIMDNIGAFNKNYWIGLTRVPATWLDGSSLTYDNTVSISFNEGGECFITHYSSWENWQGDWHDKECSSEYRYICEKEISD